MKDDRDPQEIGEVLMRYRETSDKPLHQIYDREFGPLLTTPPQGVLFETMADLETVYGPNQHDENFFGSHPHNLNGHGDLNDCIE